MRRHDLRVLFWGTPVFALPSLRALGEEGHDIVGVVTQPDRPFGRGRRMRPSPVREVAEEEGIPVLVPEKPRGEEFMNELRALEPDISVVVAYGHLLLPEVLALPPGGSINVHASLLPELRGAAPVHWAILQGKKTTGVTVMRMAEKMDAGPIIFQTPEDIGPKETATELGTRLSEVGAEALVEALVLLQGGAVVEREQDHASATFAPKVNREMARIDWDRPAKGVGDHVRGLDSVPGAWTTLDGESVKLFGPNVESRFVHGAEPGSVLATDPDRGILVGCAEGALWVGEIQSPGRKRMAVGPWLQGRALPEGTVFA